MENEDDILDDLLDDDSSISVPDPVSKDDISEDLWSDLVKLTNPYLEDKVFMKKAIRRESQKHKEAFLYWNALSDAFRTDRAVAEQYSVSAAVVGKWRKSFNWQGRRDYLRREDLKRFEDAASRTLDDELKGMLSTSALVVSRFHQQIAAKTNISVADFIKIGEFLVKLHNTLNGPKKESDDDGTPLGKLEGLLAGATGSDIKQLMGAILHATVKDGDKLPHDTAIETEVGRKLQESIIVNEIGEDGHRFGER